jgi:uncharacterized protein YPO0396
MLALRRSVADGAGISEGSLPFAGELIQVLPSEEAWQPAIERLLRNFALSLLVEDRHYLSVSRFINDTNLGQRLFYYRTILPETSVVRPVPGNSLVRKLETKESPVQEWLKSELRIRFDYECVENLQEFRRSERAITREGQIKHSKTRHEKDDRRGRDGRLQRLLGFDNREKRAEFEKFAQELAEQISDLDNHLRALAEKERGEQERRIHWQTIVNLQWQEIDVVPLVERISSLEMRLQEATESNIQLRQLSQQVESARRTADGAERLWQDASVQHGEIRRRLEEAGARVSRILASPPATVPVEIRTELDGRFEKDGAITLDSIESLATGVLQAIHREVVDIMRRIAASEKAIEARFVEFARKWPADSGDVQANLASAKDFFAKLTRLETDGLPAHEYRFFELLRTQSHQNLAALATHLSNARKEILSRMEVVNSSLRTLPFNRNAEQTTYLKIEANDKQLSVVRDFRQAVQQALSHAWAEDDREQAEGRFLVIRGLVERLSSQNPEDKRWMDLVLDVRQHVEFIGRELDQDDIEIETYRSGAGKSGGQRQKLATTCLAAALRYQLGGSDHGMPQYSTVVLDEAFDKADNEFTALAMNIFISFGFQMIVATPLKSVMTLEPFIGGACYVDISDRRTSAVMLIEYESDTHRLKLPDHARREESLEIS